MAWKLHFIKPIISPPFGNFQSQLLGAFGSSKMRPGREVPKDQRIISQRKTSFPRLNNVTSDHHRRLLDVKSNVTSDVINVLDVKKWLEMQIGFNVKTNDSTKQEQREQKTKEKHFVSMSTKLCLQEEILFDKYLANYICLRK